MGKTYSIRKVGVGGWSSRPLKKKNECWSLFHIPPPPCKSVEATSHNLEADAAIEGGIARHLERWHQKLLWEKFRETLARLWNLNLPTTEPSSSGQMSTQSPNYEGQRRKSFAKLLPSQIYSILASLSSLVGFDVDLPFSSRH